MEHMSKIRIKNREYRVDDIKDELQSKWKDGRPYIVEYYELFDEEDDEPRFLMIWSGDNYELCDEPNSVIPLMEGNVTEIRGI